ncbi:MAG: 23S rRNA (adenine(1618)-N(6))-methyltransferase RlmF [Campylobacterota bacterium]|nr:23S rRNA (adenine(1618)-N(6))-methyltransferase RlmF [Campylobacterota bacterium]
MKKDTTKKQLHPRNPHNSRYDFDKLTKSFPDLKQFVALNKYDDLSIDFANPKAVLALNKSLLAHYYEIENWEIPEDYLVPPIPGRADYIHYIADLLAKSNNGKIPTKNIKALDVGIGANCIYPIIGSYSYSWEFVGSDIDEDALKSANNIINQNQHLTQKIKTIHQANKNNIFTNIINENDKFDFTICNPPFHKSAQDAIQGTKRKVKNLTKSKEKLRRPTLNFGGQKNELWCDGGEIEFISKMIKESTKFKENCFWFTTLVSKQDNLPQINHLLRNAHATQVETINMAQGNKISRIVAWTFLTKEMQNNWNKNKENQDAK